MTFHDDEPIGRATRAILTAQRATELEEQSFRMLAGSMLRLAYPGSAATVEPAAGRPEGALGLGVLDVRLEWPMRSETPLALRVVVHDELARAAWREASTVIGDAVRTAIRERCPAHFDPKREGP